LRKEYLIKLNLGSNITCQVHTSIPVS